MAARLERVCHEAGAGRHNALCTTVNSPLWDTLRAGWPSDEPLVVADVGANKGFFSAIALARFSPACGVNSADLFRRACAPRYDYSNLAPPRAHLRVERRLEAFLHRHLAHRLMSGRRSRPCRPRRRKDVVVDGHVEVLEVGLGLLARL